MVQTPSLVRHMRTWSSCTEILQPTVPPVELHCHHHYLLNQFKEVCYCLKTLNQFTVSVTVTLCVLTSTGRSDPQISSVTQDGSNLRRRSSNPSTHTSTSQTQSRHVNSESPGQGGRPPRSPHGQGCLQRTHRQTWDGQSTASSGSQSTLVSPQNPVGPVRWVEN